MLQKIKNLYTRKTIFEKVNQLDIASSGIDADGDPYVKLKNGTTFFGNKVKSVRFDKSFYNSLKSPIKKVLKYECSQVAKDIVIRYVEGGLQYGGPKKQSRYSVQANDHVAEMGAYQGFCSVKLAQQVGKNGKVIAIEPMPDNFRLLQKNKIINGLDQMTVVNKGVWDSTKDLYFNRKIGDGQSSSIEMDYKDNEQFKVKADTLDNIFKEVSILPKDFMIIQLNGAEINGLRGLTTFKPKHLSIAARYDTEGVDAALAIKKILEERGYKVEIEEDDFVFAELV